MQSGAPNGTGCPHLFVGHSEHRSARFTVADAVAYVPTKMGFRYDEGCAYDTANIWPRSSEGSAFVPAAIWPHSD